MSLRRNLSAAVPPTLPISVNNQQPAFAHEPFALSCQIVPDTDLTSQGVHLVGVLVENAVNYCSVSRPRCRSSLCTPTNHNIICQLRGMLLRARGQLLQVELRFHRVRRRLPALPSQIGRNTIVVLQQIHCQLRQIVHEVHITRDRYCRSQTRFQVIQVMVLHTACPSQYAVRLHQLQRSCCVQTCQRLENSRLFLERVGHLLSTLLGQLRPRAIAMVHPPCPSPPSHNPPQAAAWPAFLVGEENLQHFQVQTEEKSKELVSKQ